MKVKCPRCGYKGEVVDKKCLICELPLQSSPRSSIFSTFINQNKFVSIVILFLVIIFILIGFSLYLKYKGLLTIMLTNDPKEIVSAVYNISDSDQLKIQERIVASYDSPDQATKDKWKMVSDALRMKSLIKQYFEASNKDEEKKQYDIKLAEHKESAKPFNLKVFIAIFIPLFIVFSIICVTLFLFIKLGFWHFIGTFLVLFGLAGLFISLAMSTAIDGIYNIGLLSNKQNFVMISLVIFLSGIIFQAARYYSERKERNT